MGEKKTLGTSIKHSLSLYCGAKDYMVLKGTLVISLSLSQAEQKMHGLKNEKKHKTNNFFDKGALAYPYPVGNRVKLHFKYYKRSVHPISKHG